jgi:hypothetical protein
MLVALVALVVLMALVALVALVKVLVIFWWGTWICRSNWSRPQKALLLVGVVLRVGALRVLMVLVVMVVVLLLLLVLLVLVQVSVQVSGTYYQGAGVVPLAAWYPLDHGASLTGRPSCTDPRSTDPTDTISRTTRSARAPARCGRTRQAPWCPLNLTAHGDPHR